MSFIPPLLCPTTLPFHPRTCPVGTRLSRGHPAEGLLLTSGTLRTVLGLARTSLMIRHMARWPCSPVAGWQSGSTQQYDGRSTPGPALARATPCLCVAVAIPQDVASKAPAGRHGMGMVFNSASPCLGFLKWSGTTYRHCFVTAPASPGWITTSFSLSRRLQHFGSL